jgi:hypothetical protein
MFAPPRCLASAAMEHPNASTFRQDVLDVLGYDDRIVLVIHETGTAQGQAFDNRAIYRVGIVDGKWASLPTMDMGHDKINAFWAAVQVPALTAS